MRRDSFFAAEECSNPEMGKKENVLSMVRVVRASVRQME